MWRTSACCLSAYCGNARRRQVESQRLLMPLVIELTPAQQAVFSEIATELAHNGFEAEPFGSRSIAVKVAPAGVDAAQIEHMLNEVLEQLTREDQAINLEAVRTRIAASIACHAAIKVNMPLEQNKMEWLLAELAKTEHPDDVSAWQAGGVALHDDGNSAGVQENLERLMTSRGGAWLASCDEAWRL